MSGQTVRSPYDLFGPLLAAVQMRGIFADGKTFVDAEPLHSVPEIMRGFADIAAEDDRALESFVRANFRLPQPVEAWSGSPEPTLKAHISASWSLLTREPRVTSGSGSELSIGHRYVVPGGRFRELYYWDSFFAMLGLIRDGRADLAKGMVDVATDLIEQYGHVPNGTRTYYVGRSQPPFYHLMVALLGEQASTDTSRYLDAMKSEHAWWMRGEGAIEPGGCDQRVVRLIDGSLLNRYWDPRSIPRDESWREDTETAATSDRPAGEIYRDLRAGAESGWDFSSRWLDDGELASITTTSIVPVDLNSYLYSLEKAIAGSGTVDAGEYERRADRRLTAIQKHCWNDQIGFFVDHDVRTQAGRAPTAAGLAPLLCNVATPDQAHAMAQFVEAFMLAPGGLRTTLVCSGQQWDAPNGWAPLQWIGIQGLENHGYSDLAARIAGNWIGNVSNIFQVTGHVHEKYDIESCSVGGGGEYEPQLGFGWTNGVTRDLMHRFGRRLSDPKVIGSNATSGHHSPPEPQLSGRNGRLANDGN